MIIDMTRYDENELEKWSYGLDRNYRRFCPNFNKTEITEINVMEQK